MHGANHTSVTEPCASHQEVFSAVKTFQRGNLITAFALHSVTLVRLGLTHLSISLKCVSRKVIYFDVNASSFENRFNILSPLLILCRIEQHIELYSVLCRIVQCHLTLHLRKIIHHRLKLRLVKGFKLCGMVFDVLPSKIPP